MSHLKPPAQAAAASAAVGADAAANAQRQRAEAASASSRCKNRVAKHRKQSWDCITSAGAPRGASGITSRARATLGITAARAFPHAGRWESLATRAGTACWNLGRLPEPHSVLNSAAEYPRAHYRTDSVHTSVSRITVTCRVRNKLNNLSIFRPSRGDGDHS